MSEFGTLDSRVHRKALLDKVVSAEECIQFFKSGMDLGWSGFTPAGYPKAIPIALADHVEKKQPARPIEIQSVHWRICRC